MLEHGPAARPQVVPFSNVTPGPFSLDIWKCWKPAFTRYLFVKLTGLQRELVTYLQYYNEERVHRGRHTKGRTPLAVLSQAAGRPVI